MSVSLVFSIGQSAGLLVLFDDMVPGSILGGTLAFSYFCALDLPFLEHINFIYYVYTHNIKFLFQGVFDMTKYRESRQNCYKME